MDPRDRRLCNPVAASPGTEDLLEAAGIDYRFGGDRTLREAWAAAKTDADNVVTRRGNRHHHEAVRRRTVISAVRNHLDTG